MVSGAPPSMAPDRVRSPDTAGRHPAASPAGHPAPARRTEPDCIYIGGSSRGGPPLVLGIDGLLAVVADVRRLREMRAGADKGGKRCLEMLLCPLTPGRVPHNGLRVIYSVLYSTSISLSASC